MKFLAYSRRGLQLGVLGWCLWIAFRLHEVVRWAAGASAVWHAKPPSAEGFLPLSALVALKGWVLTGRFDDVHPAGLVIFLAVLTLAFALRKAFCGWVCPVGAVSQWLAGLGARFGLALRPPRWLGLPLHAVKYLLLAFFLYGILWKMDAAAVEAFVHSPYNAVADLRLFEFFAHPSPTLVAVLSGLGLGSLLIRGLWCRYFCPYGALLGLVAMAGPLRLTRHPDRCAGCRACDAACPVDIEVHAREGIGGPECLGCLRCVETCPREGALGLEARGRSVDARLVPLAVLAILGGAWALGVFTGHWVSRVPSELLRVFFALV